MAVKPKYIGHKTARRKLLPGEPITSMDGVKYMSSDKWFYEDKINWSLSIYLGMKNCNLLDLDTFIERLEFEKAPAGRELRERRQLAYAAFCAKPQNHDAIARHIEWIMNRKRAIETCEAADRPAKVGMKSIEGHKNRDDYADKIAFISLVQGLHKTLPHPPCNMAEWKRRLEIKPYAKKYSGRDTLRNWVKEALPGTLKNGRPKKKHTAIP